jgi:hypothetical protein
MLWAVTAHETTTVSKRSIGMNNVYFACQTCKSYLDAGYRWCYWTLEHPGHVSQGHLIDVARILAVPEYWHGTATEVGLPAPTKQAIRAFLVRHQAHELLYGEDEAFLHYPHYTFLYWINEDETNRTDVSVRTCIERFHLTTWEAVTHHVEQGIIDPWWWEVNDIRQYAQQAFVALLEQHNQHR